MTSSLAATNFDSNGSYYASAITALDTHKIRVQSTNPSTSLAAAFSLDKGHKLTSLSWGLSPNVDSKSQKKKRRLSQSFSIENQVVSIGLNKGSILIYSPTANEIQGKLENPNASSINDYIFSSITNSGWSVDVGQNVIEWDLILFKPKQQFQFKETVNVIRVIEYQNKPHLLLGSHSISLVDIQTKEVVKTFPGHISPIHSIIPFDDQSHFITAAHGDRYVNIYSLENSTSSVLVTQSNVLSISFAEDSLSAVTEDGIVEIFTNPLSSTKSTSSKRQAQKSKQSNFKIDLKRPNGDSLRIEDSYITSEFITITWLEDGSIPYFEKIKIETLTESTTVTKSRPKIQAKNHSLFGQDIAAPKRYNESHAVVTSGDNFKFLDNKEVENDEEEDDGDTDAPSLAERIESMKVETTGPRKKQGRATTGSLVVLLTQALRSNDHGLLETVLTNRDESVLKSTIQRLDTSFAVTLLERLAERIARQTNRQGQLNVWVKWVMIIHGGYLVNVPNLAKSLSSLHSTLSRRANTLPRLLELQGRLDVLYSQHELNRTNTQAEQEYNESDDESDVEYVEELDDANLIDNAEDEEIVEQEDGFMSLDEESEDDSEEIEQDDDDDDDEIELEEGYSDEEVNGVNDEDSASEDEQELLKKRIEKLKTKQSKGK